ncbi:MAG: metallophosphoesterase, partial [Lachnospiraceae bacterium]|nr:metallophosphoesterase [Lachnospiraceae bacterium]
MIRKITSDKPFKILGFTDTHLDDYADRFEVTLKLMVETIQTEKPDMVVFVGDNVTGGDNRDRAEHFRQTMTQ